jgi:putative addiction module killer protein
MQWYILEIRETSASATWFATLRDRAAKARIDIRIRRLSLGNPGNVRSVDEGLSELRIHYGPGYRIYFTKQEEIVIVLLAGRDKSSQEKDIRKAKDLSCNL